MTRRVALLRAVNVGGTGKLAMADLRAAASAEGFDDVATILQSGSLVFSASGAPKALEQRIERMLAARFGLASDVMVRDAKDGRRSSRATRFRRWPHETPRTCSRSS